MSFSQNWFESLQGKSNFNSLKNLINLNDPIKYLEIGVFEGNAHLHVYSNLFKNCDLTSVAIDPFGNGTGNSRHHDVEDIFRSNLKDYIDNIIIIKDISNKILPLLKENYFNIVYIDGDHTGKAAYNDGINSWSLLKKNGIMIFDDYLWLNFRHENENLPENMAIGEEDHPAIGINKFLDENEGKYRFLTKEDGLELDCKKLNLNTDILKLYSSKEVIKNYNYQMLIQKL